MPQIYPPKKRPSGIRWERTASGILLAPREPGETVVQQKQRTIKLLHETAAAMRQARQYESAGGIMRNIGTLKKEIAGTPLMARPNPVAKGAKKPRVVDVPNSTSYAKGVSKPAPTKSKSALPPVELPPRRAGESDAAWRDRSIGLLNAAVRGLRADPNPRLSAPGIAHIQAKIAELQRSAQPLIAQTNPALRGKKPRVVDVPNSTPYAKYVSPPRLTPETQAAVNAYKAERARVEALAQANGLRTSNPNYTGDLDAASAYGMAARPDEPGRLGGYGNVVRKYGNQVRAFERVLGAGVASLLPMDPYLVQTLLHGGGDDARTYDPREKRLRTKAERGLESIGTLAKNFLPGPASILDEDPVATAENAVFAGAFGAAGHLLAPTFGKLAPKVAKAAGLEGQIVKGAEGSMGNAFEREAGTGSKGMAEAHPALQDHNLTSAVHDVDDTGILRPKDPDMVELEPGKHAIREIIWRDWIKNKDQGLFANKAQREETLRLVDLLDYDLVSRLRVRISKEAESSVKGVTAGGNYDFVKYVAHLSRVISHEIGTENRNATRVLAHEMAHHLQHFMTQADVDAIKDQFLRELKHRDKRIFDPLNSPRRWANAEEWWASQIEEMLYQKVSGPRFNDASPEFVKATKEFWRSLVGMMDTTRRFFLRGGRRDQAKIIYNDMVRMSKQMKNDAFQPWDLEHGKPIGKQLEGIIPPQGGPRRR